MMNRHFQFAVRFSSLLLMVLFITACAPKTAPLSDEEVKSKTEKLPLSFQENRGQVKEEVKYLVKNGSTTVFFTPEEVVYNMVKREATPPEIPTKEKKPPTSLDKGIVKQQVIRQSFDGANKTPEISGEEELPGKVNYMVGSDRSKWQKGIRTFASVHYAKLYPGIDLIYSGVASQFNYRYVVDAGVDYQLIRVKLAGVSELSVTGEGNLVMKHELGESLIKKPMAYQEIAGEKKSLSAQYVVLDKDSYGFEIGSVDVTVPLLITSE